MAKGIKNSKYTLWLMIGLCALCVAGGVLFFVMANLNQVAYRKVILNICGFLCLIMALLFLYLLYLTRDTEPNFFLYDKRIRRNIPVDKLNFAMIDSKMTFFISLIADSEEVLWKSDLLMQGDKFGYRGVYRPLVAYKMLYDLTEKDDEDNWKLFSEAGDDVIHLVSEALEQNGEQDMPRALIHFHSAGTDSSRVRDFLVGNKKYIQGKMLGYVRRNLEMFY